jgi:hypothetical protein
MAVDVLIRPVDPIQLSAVSSTGTGTLYQKYRTPIKAFCGHVFELSISAGILNVILCIFVGGNQGFGEIFCICFRLQGQRQTYCSRNLGQFIIV